MIRAPLLLALLAAALVAVAVVQVQTACTAAGQWRSLASTFTNADFGGANEADVQRYVMENAPTTHVEGLRLSLAAIDMHLHAGHLTSALMLADRVQKAAPGSTISGVASRIHDTLLRAVIEILLAGAAFVAAYTMWRTEGIRKEASA